MCGRYTLKFTLQEVSEIFGIKNSGKTFNPSYNIAPSQNVPAISKIDGELIIDLYKWGLVPHWAKDEKIGNRLVNARAETIAEKPAFRDAFLHSRCLIPASGFYEWKKTATGKTPYYFYIGQREVFCFAGIYSEWESKGGKKIKSCSIITKPADSAVGKMHDRMPITLSKDSENNWIDKTTEKEKLTQMLDKSNGENLLFHEVSVLVNSPKNNNPELINPI